MKILIIGGMGPQAGLALHHKIIETSSKNGAMHGDEFPSIIHVSVPVPEFIDSTNNGKDALNIIREHLHVFRGIDFTHIVIACNTAHLFIEEISGLLTSRPLSLIETTAEFVNHSNIKTIGILGTPTTIRKGLHKKVFKNVKVVMLDQNGMKKTSQIIHDVIAGRKDLAPELHGQIEILLNIGAEAVLLGCTELSVINHDIPHRSAIDPLDIVVRKIFA